MHHSCLSLSVKTANKHVWPSPLYFPPHVHHLLRRASCATFRVKVRKGRNVSFLKHLGFHGCRKRSGWLLSACFCCISDRLLHSYVSHHGAVCGAALRADGSSLTWMWVRLKGLLSVFDAQVYCDGNKNSWYYERDELLMSFMKEKWRKTQNCSCAGSSSSSFIQENLKSSLMLKQLQHKQKLEKLHYQW